LNSVFEILLFSVYLAFSSINCSSNSLLHESDPILSVKMLRKITNINKLIKMTEDNHIDQRS